MPTGLDRADAASPATPACTRRSAAVRRANKVALATADPRPARHPRRSERAVRRPDQAHPRIQAPASQHPGDDRALSGDARAAAQGMGAARQDLRRQGGGELPPGQADHQARQRRRPGGQQRPDGARPAEGRVPAELQCQPRRDDHSGCRPVGADLDGRHGGLGHRQHEAGAQRRARPSARSTAPMSRSGSMSATTTSSSSA